MNDEARTLFEMIILGAAIGGVAWFGGDLIMSWLSKWGDDDES